MSQQCKLVFCGWRPTLTEGLDADVVFMQCIRASH